MKEYHISHIVRQKQETCSRLAGAEQWLPVTMMQLIWFPLYFVFLASLSLWSMTAMLLQAAISWSALIPALMKDNGALM